MLKLKEKLSKEKKIRFNTAAHLIIIITANATNLLIMAPCMTRFIVTIRGTVEDSYNTLQGTIQEQLSSHCLMMTSLTDDMNEAELKENKMIALVTTKQ